MIGLDTNVIVRLLLRDSESQVRRAHALLAGSAGARVNELVIAESVWVLSQKLGLPRRNIEARLAALLTGNRIAPLDPAALDRARREAETHGFGLADGLIGARNAAAGCETTYTFDRRAARSDLFTMVP